MNIFTIILNTRVKMPPKKGMFRAIKVKAKSGRGGMDAEDTWAQFMSKESAQYESIMEQYNAASQEDKDAARGYLNEISDGFGEDFYESRQMAGMIWADCTEKDAIAAFIKENMLSPESGE